MYSAMHRQGLQSNDSSSQAQHQQQGDADLDDSMAALRRDALSMLQSQTNSAMSRFQSEPHLSSSGKHVSFALDENNVVYPGYQLQDKNIYSAKSHQALDVGQSATVSPDQFSSGTPSLRQERSSSAHPKSVRPPSGIIKTSSISNRPSSATKAARPGSGRSYSARSSSRPAAKQTTGPRYGVKKPTTHIKHSAGSAKYNTEHSSVGNHRSILHPKSALRHRNVESRTRMSGLEYLPEHSDTSPGGYNQNEQQAVSKDVGLSRPKTSRGPSSAENAASKFQGRPKTSRGPTQDIASRSTQSTHSKSLELCTPSVINRSCNLQDNRGMFKDLQTLDQLRVHDDIKVTSGCTLIHMTMLATESDFMKKTSQEMIAQKPDTTNSYMCVSCHDLACGCKFQHTVRRFIQEAGRGQRSHAYKRQYMVPKGLHLKQQARTQKSDNSLAALLDTLVLHENSDFSDGHKSRTHLGLRISKNDDHQIPSNNINGSPTFFNIADPEEGFNHHTPNVYTPENRKQISLQLENHNDRKERIHHRSLDSHLIENRNRKKMEEYLSWKPVSVKNAFLVSGPHWSSRGHTQRWHWKGGLSSVMWQPGGTTDVVALSTS